MNKSFEILFDYFVNKKISEDAEKAFDKLYAIVEEEKTTKQMYNIDILFGEYEFAVRKDAFKAMNQHQNDEKIIKLLSEIKNNLIKNNEYID